MIKKSVFLFSLITIPFKGYDLAYLNSLKADVADDVSKLKKTLKYSWDGLVISGLSSVIPQEMLKGREKIELESVYRFKCVSNASDSVFDKWIAKQTDASVKALLESVDKYPDKKSLITWQNQQYPEYLTIDQAYERLVQSKHFEKKFSKKS